MPSFPKLRDGLAQVGEVEVLPKVEAEYFRQANGHIRIAGKVKIQLEAVDGDAQSGRGRVHMPLLGHGAQERAQLVGQQDLFGKADQHTLTPGAHLV